MCKQSQSLLLCSPWVPKRSRTGRSWQEEEEDRNAKQWGGQLNNKSPKFDRFSLHSSWHSWGSVRQRALQTKSLWCLSHVLPSLSKVGFIDWVKLCEKSKFIIVCPKKKCHDKELPTHSRITIMDHCNHHYHTLFVTQCHVSQRLMLYLFLWPAGGLMEFRGQCKGKQKC